MERTKIIERVKMLKEEALKYGAVLDLNADDIIDMEHLDCFWYGGPLATIEYRGEKINFDIHGEVRLSILDETFDQEIYRYINKNNSGAYSDAELRGYIKNDAQLQEMDNSGRLAWHNNNWIEFFAEVNGEELNDVVGENNILEAFKDIKPYIDMIDEELAAWTDSVTDPKSSVTTQKLKKAYPVNTKIVLDKMDDIQAPPVGTVGIVTKVDDMGDICVNWETGSTLKIIVGVDKFHVIHSEQ